MVAAGVVTTSPDNISWYLVLVPMVLVPMLPQHLLVLGTGSHGAGAGSHAATTFPGNISWYLVLVPMVLVPMLLQHLLVLNMVIVLFIREKITYKYLYRMYINLHSITAVNENITMGK